MVRQVALLNPATPPAALTRQGNLTCNLMLAANPSAPATTLEVLAHDPYSDVRQAVARNVRANSSLLADLTRAVARWWRGELPIVFMSLAPDSYDLVRQALASNRWCDRRWLHQLARDQVAEVRAAGARNRAMPSVTLDALARDDSLPVRLAVAHNDLASLDTQWTLAADAHHEVVETVARWTIDPDLLYSLLQEREAIGRS